MEISTRRRNPQLARLARQHILDSVTRIITRDGVQYLTMDKVAAEAGLAKGTLYRYFRTKGALLQAAVENCMPPLTNELIGILDQDSPPDERLSRMILHHLSFFDRHHDFFRVLLYDRSLAQSKAAR